MTGPIDEIASMENWRDATERRRAEVVAAVADELDLVPLDVVEHGGAKVPIGSLRHQASGTVLRLLPGGVFRMGLSDGERAVLETMRADAIARGRVWDAYEAALDADEDDEDDDEDLYDPNYDPHYADTIDAEILGAYIDADVAGGKMTPARQVRVPRSLSPPIR